jgi:predicted  nucleic acid-binding Zn-ribbon protein
LFFLQVQGNLEAASRAKVELEQRVAELVEEKKDLEAALRQEERSKENLGEQLSEAGAQLQVRRRVP